MPKAFKKQLIVYSVSVAVVFSPTLSLAAQKKNLAEDQTAIIKEFYRDTGYKGGTSVGAWLEQNPKSMHYKLRMMMQRMHYTHPEQKLPLLDFSDYQQDGKTYTRVVMKDGEDQQIIDVYKNKDQYVFKKDGVTFSYDDLYYADPIEIEGVVPALTLDQLKAASQVNPAAAADYLVQFREMMNAMTVMTNLADGEQPQFSPPFPSPFSYVNFILEVAHASDKDGKCVTGGNFSKLSTAPGSTGSCGADDSTKNQVLYCQKPKSSHFRCNPLVYGFDSKGEAICIAPQNRKPSVYVSEGCNAAYDLRDPSAKSRFLDSVINNGDKIGVRDPADFFQKLQDYIKSAGEHCGLPKGEFEARVRAGIPNSFTPNEFVEAFPVRVAKSGNKKFDYNEGHRTACAYLMNRLVLTQQAAKCSQNLVLARDSASPEDRKNAEKCYDGAVVPAPVTTQPEAPISDCEKLKARSADIRAEYEAGRLGETQARNLYEALGDEQKRIKDCSALSPWLPLLPLTPGTTTNGTVTTATATVSPPPPSPRTAPPRKSSNPCSGNKLIACGVIGAVIACKLGLCKGKKSRPGPMTVGKPAESQNTVPGTSRPVPASGVR